MSGKCRVIVAGVESVHDLSVMWEGLGGRGADVDDGSVRVQSISAKTGGNMARPDKAVDFFSGYSACRGHFRGFWDSLGTMASVWLKLLYSLSKKVSMGNKAVSM